MGRLFILIAKMSLYKLTILFVLSVGISSCSGLNLPKGEVKPITLHFSGTFSNQLDRSKWSGEEPTILELFNIDDTTKHVVHLRFIDYQHLHITAWDSSNVRNISEWTFKGKFKRRGYFEIYHYKNNFCVPLVYRQRVYDKIRMALSPNSDLIIRNETDESKYVFFIKTEVGLTLLENATFFYKPVPHPEYVIPENQ